jgi:2-beta-glucuronyltransferase
MRRQVNEDAGISLPILRRGGCIAHTRRMAAAPPASRRVVFITSKYWKATSKVGFHFLAQSFARAGWDVLFITTHLSRLAAALGTRRALARRARAEANRLVDTDGVASYAWYTPWHPVNLRFRLLNRATMGLFRRYGELPLGAEPLVATAERIIFDSGPELLLLERFKSLAPAAAFVYRVSDDLRHSGIHPTVVQVEDEVAPRFDLVSVPCAYIAERFRGLPRVAIQHHGIDKALFDPDYLDPYGADNRPRALFVGQHPLDLGFLATASALAPEWTFHVIGPIAGLPRRDNVRAHGEMPFAATIPFIKHCDIGLQALAPHDGAEAFTDSLKVIQYTYCRLPILAPSFLRSPRPNFVFYNPGDRASIGRALEEARRFDRGRVDTAEVRSWDDLADQLGRGAVPRRA